MRTRAVEPLVTPTNSVLVLVDFQPFQFGAVRQAAPGPLLDAAVELAATATALDVPTVALTLVEEFDGAVVEPLAVAARDAQVVDRVEVDPSRDLATVDSIRRTGRATLVVAGLWTGGCVTTLALAALDAGHDVVVVADACADVTAAGHDRALGCLAGAGVVTTTVAALAAEWARARRSRTRSASRPEDRAPSVELVPSA